VTWAAVALVGLAAAWWLVRVLRSSGHRLSCGCHLVMGVGMAIMLVEMNGVA
jgi:hypothetical protein